MGFYLNPLDGSDKRHFLEDHGIRVPDKVKFTDVAKDCFIVCLVSNGPFEAAAIAYTPEELEVFQAINDPRPKWFFAIEKEKAKGAMDPSSIQYLTKEGYM